LLLSDRFITIEWLKWLLQVGAFLILMIITQFFRNPKRTFILENHILAPVDGKVSY
jgi:phosphatidylserine decarboxylase